jgi:hypothetical protein
MCHLLFLQAAEGGSSVLWTGDADGVETSHDTDARAILERNLKINQEGKTNFDTGTYQVSLSVSRTRIVVLKYHHDQ